MRQATGKGWQEWFAVLDAAGGRELDHKAIVAVLSQKEGVAPWWQQQITVGFERARGLREAHETPAGFQVGRSRTLAAPVERVFAAWHDERLRRRWLPNPEVEVRRATENKSLRITWADGRSRLDVELYPKGPDKTQVSVQHSKLEDAAAAAEMKAYWANALTALKKLVEGL
ncbi:MAG: SRPBCC family protein [Candidatus Promineifilaceae bacterium]